MLYEVITALVCAIRHDTRLTVSEVALCFGLGDCLFGVWHRRRLTSPYLLARLLLDACSLLGLFLRLLRLGLCLLSRLGFEFGLCSPDLGQPLFPSRQLFR